MPDHATANPFEGDDARQHSCYCAPKKDRPDTLVKVVESDSPVQTLTEYVHGQLRPLITKTAFPCVLGRSALNKNSYRFGLYRDMLQDGPVRGLCHDLWRFVQEQPLREHEFSTFIASFQAPYPNNEKDFETNLWTLLQRLHDEDVAYHAWDESTDSDPSSRRFSFSFAGRSYFVVGLHPRSSRFSRRFTYPTVVFNAHYQFQNLRNEGKFEHFKAVIRENDERLQGNINPSLQSYGDDSEAKQYSGRLVEAAWRCPFTPKI